MNLDSWQNRNNNICYNRRRWNRIALIFFYYIFGGDLLVESKFQAKLIKELEERFPGCIVMKNDSGNIQGIPDLTIFYEDKWATLECKKNASASHQPNQDFYVNKMNAMSFSRFIYPENKQEVLDELQRSFGLGGAT